MGRPGRRPSSIIDHSGVVPRGPDRIHNVLDRRNGPDQINSWEVEPISYDALNPTSDIGADVIYRDGLRRPEVGTISSWRNGLVFVRFTSGSTAAACSPADLLRGKRRITVRGYEPKLVAEDIPEADDGLDPYADAILFVTGHLPEDF